MIVRFVMKLSTALIPGNRKNSNNSNSMTTLDRLSRLFTWAILFLVLLWLCLFAVPQFIDRVSRHESYWLDQGFEHTGKLMEER